MGEEKEKEFRKGYATSVKKKQSILGTEKEILWE